MPSKDAWPVPRRRRVVGVRIQKGVVLWNKTLNSCALSCSWFIQAFGHQGLHQEESRKVVFM